MFSFTISIGKYLRCIIGVIYDEGTKNGLEIKQHVSSIWPVRGLFTRMESNKGPHYNDVIMSKIASQITSLTIVYSTFYSGPDQTKHQSSASLAFVRGIPRTNDRWRGQCFDLMTSSWFTWHMFTINGRYNTYIIARCRLYWHGLSGFRAWISNFIMEDTCSQPSGNSVLPKI